eukprot:3883587-Pyramimonas_sp.AAC.1
MHGWVSVASVDRRVHKVAVYDPVTSTVKYEHPTETPRFPLEDGDLLFETRTDRVSLLTTANHKLWVRPSSGSEYSLVPAAEVPESHVHSKGCAKGLDLAWQEVPPMASGHVRNFLNFLYVFGYWFRRGGIRDGIVHFRARATDEITMHLCACGLSFSVVNDAVLYLENEQADSLAALLSGCCATEMHTESPGAGLTGRVLPSWALRMSPAHSVALLRALFGDSLVWTSSNRVLCDQVQQLALHAGTCIDLDFAPAGVAIAMHLSVSSALEARVGPGQHRTRTARPADGHSVYCVTVRTGIVLVRRDGKPVWCGNSARHGQKGTIGMTYTQEDMPFSLQTGMSPDIIINPHAIPSRMTIGQLLECVAGKAACFDGKIKDATAFEARGNHESLFRALAAQGFQRHGNETLVNGFTGLPLQHAIFVGPTYYQRLKHMVDDKIHSRGRGPVQVLTRQPVEGRSRDGGLRTGEMERDAIISHG